MVKRFLVETGSKTGFGVNWDGVGSSVVRARLAGAIHHGL